MVSGNYIVISVPAARLSQNKLELFTASYAGLMAAPELQIRNRDRTVHTQDKIRDVFYFTKRHRQKRAKKLYWRPSIKSGLNADTGKIAIALQRFLAIVIRELCP